MLLGLRYGPQFLFDYVIYDLGKNDPPLPLTGSEVARQLLERAGAGDVKLVELPANAPPFYDHYDVEKRQIALSPAVARSRTVVSYAIAAHEVGHALQYREGDPRVAWVGRLSRLGAWLYLLLAIVAVPVIFFPDWFDRNGQQAVLWAIATIVLGDVIIRFGSVGVEWDASFGRALPNLVASGLLPPEHLPRARRVLFAAATTYIGFAIAGALGMLILLVF